MQARRGKRQERIEEVALDRNAFARELHRRRDQFGEREPPRAVPRVGKRQARDRAGHADPERAVARFFRVGVSIGVKKHVRRRRRRGGLAIIDGDVLARLRPVQHHEATATEIAGPRQRYRERKANRNGGIDRVSAFGQNFRPNPARLFLLRDHHAMLRHHRLGAQRICAPRDWLLAGDPRARKHERNCQESNRSNSSTQVHGRLQELSSAM